jgi:hypothetical protein
MGVPTPADIAVRRAAVVARRGDDVLKTSFDQCFPDLVRAVHRLGMDASREIGEWVDATSADEVADWLDTSTSGHAIALRWKTALQSKRYPSLFETLVQESHFGLRISKVGPYLRPQGLRVDTSIGKLRERVANAAYYRAMNEGWARPIVFSNTLDLASVYLQNLIDRADSEEVDASG